MTVKNQVIEALKTGPKTSTEIADLTQLKRSSVKVALCAMHKKNAISREKIKTQGAGPNEVYCYRLVTA
jgi:predicted transcriptional regulator